MTSLPRVNFLAALRLPPGAGIVVYAGELPAALVLPPSVRRADTCVIGVTYRDEPLMLFSCPREEIDGLGTTIQSVLDQAVNGQRSGATPPALVPAIELRGHVRDQEQSITSPSVRE